MKLHPLAAGYTVSPQITPEDMPRLAAAGIGIVVCNRPDSENPPELRSDVMQSAAERNGMRFVYNPYSHGDPLPRAVATQAAVITDEGAPPILAYCASGTRSATLWALALAGRQPADELIAAAAREGYRIEQIKPQIEELARAAG